MDDGTIDVGNAVLADLVGENTVELAKVAGVQALLGAAEQKLMEKSFSSIHDVVSYLRGGWAGSPLDDPDPTAAEWIDCSDLVDPSLEWIDFLGSWPRGRILPSQFSPYLYRGQVKRYLPCRPSAYRGLPLTSRPRELSESQRTRFLADYARVLWFGHVLEDHPAFSHAEEIGLQVNRWVLAQHYGLATEWMDLTQSIDVAAFFACCKPDGDQWTPVEDGEGVLYRLDISQMNAWDCVELVGLCTFPRPGEQRAWAAPVTLQGDMEKLPCVDVCIFPHQKAASKHFHDLFAGGESLFPPDPVADIAQRIRQSTVLPVNYVAHTLRQHGCPTRHLDGFFKTLAKNLQSHCGIAVENEVECGFTDDEQQVLLEYWVRRGQEFLKNVGVRHVRVFEKDKWLSTREARLLLKCSYSALRTLIRRGEIEAIRATRVGRKRASILVDRRSAQAYIEKQ